MDDDLDLVPEGFIPLREAYEAFRHWLWNGLDINSELLRTGIFVATSPAEAEQHRQQLETVLHQELLDCLEQFKTGALEALVEDSRSPSGFRTVRPRHWSEAFFPERLIIADQIAKGHSRYFDKLIGKTLLVRASELKTFFDRNRRDRLQLPSVGFCTALISSARGNEYCNADALASFEKRLLDPGLTSDGNAAGVPPRETRQQAAVRGLKTLYPIGIPLGKKNVQILHELNELLDAELDKIAITNATLRRALKAAGFGRKRP